MNIENNSIFNFDNSYLTLDECFYTKLRPVPVVCPKLIILNNQLAKSLDINIYGVDKKQLANIFSGNVLLEDAAYFSQSYMGHQYGHLNMLGDGRANMLGEQITSNNQRFDIQLKGSGITPYSRGGDGRAALGPMLREYIVSEAMFKLGIPTTRSLSVVATGENIQREKLLDGAILTRVAKSHIRFGTFEFAAAQNDPNILQQLLTYTIDRHYPELKNTKNKALSFLETVMEKQIDLVVDWMRVGFIHGVMNTDNMSIACETIDFGPCAFMDEFDPETVFSYIDKHGRYSFANQAPILQWNLAKLAEALVPIIDRDEKAAIQQSEIIINRFPEIFKSKWLSMMRKKLGLLNNEEDDLQLVEQLLHWMKQNKADHTNTFKDLSYQNLDDEAYQNEDFQTWFYQWQKRIHGTKDHSYKIMQQTNPTLIPRNHQVEKALQAAQKGNITVTHDLLEALAHPYQIDKKYNKYQLLPKPNEKVCKTFCGT